jgi:hypothetical protein
VDYREKLKDNVVGARTWGARIPGYRGYAERELRREADKLLRNYVAQAYETQRVRLLELQATLTRGKQLGTVGALERPVSKLQRLIDRLKTASQGYAGWFDAVSVQTEELDQLYQFDYALLAGSDELTAQVDALLQASKEGKDISAAIEDAGDLLEQLNQKLDGRMALITAP